MKNRSKLLHLTGFGAAKPGQHSKYVQYLQGPKAVNLSIYCQYLQRKAVNIQHQHLLRNRQLIQGWLGTLPLLVGER